jgi:hypothetical protein
LDPAIPLLAYSLGISIPLGLTVAYSTAYIAYIYIDLSSKDLLLSAQYLSLRTHHLQQIDLHPERRSSRCLPRKPNKNVGLVRLVLAVVRTRLLSMNRSCRVTLD